MCGDAATEAARFAHVCWEPCVMWGRAVSRTPRFCNGIGRRHGRAGGAVANSNHEPATQRFTKPFVTVGVGDAVVYGTTPQPQPYHFLQKNNFQFQGKILHRLG